MLLNTKAPWLALKRRRSDDFIAPIPPAWDPTDEVSLSALYRDEVASPFLANTARQFTIANVESFQHADNAAFQLSAGFILSCWMYYDAATISHQNLVCRGSGSSAAALSFRMGITNAERATAEISDGSAVTTLDDAGTGVLTPATWYFLKMWYKPGTTTLRMQVNANTIVENTSAVVLADGSFGFAVGAETDGGRPWGGRIQGLTICKIADPESVISDYHDFFYNAGAGRLPSQMSVAQATAWGVSAWYDLNENSGNAIDGLGTLDLTDTNSVTAAGGKVAYTALDGDRVSQWTDESGNNRHGQKTAYAERPTYDAAVLDGAPGSLFDGTDDRLVIANATNMFDQANGWTIAAVLVSTADGGTIYGAYSTVQLDILTNFVVNNDDLRSYTRPTGYYKVIGHYDGSGFVNVRLNGIDGTPVASTDQATANDVSMGALRDSAPFGILNGTIVECMVFAGVGDDATLMDNIDAYFDSKYPSLP